MAFLKIILIAALVFYLFALIISWIFRRKMRKLQEQLNQFGQNMHNGQSQAPPKDESPKNPRINPNIGEYTDFEEIK